MEATSGLIVSVQSGMTEKNENSTIDRRDIEKEGFTLSGSKLRDNASTDKSLHPKEMGKLDGDEIVDQDPGERQKENQNQEKDDPLAACSQVRTTMVEGGSENPTLLRPSWLSRQSSGWFAVVAGEPALFGFAAVLGVLAGLREITVARFHKRVFVAMGKLADERGVRLLFRRILLDSTFVSE